MSIDVVRNGAIYSWPSHILKINDERIVGVTKISYAVKRTRTLAYGQNRAFAPIGKTQGKFEIEPLKITMHRHTWSGVESQGAEGVRAYLAALSDDTVSYGNPGEIEISLQCAEGDNYSTVAFSHCACVGESKSVENNSDPSMVDIEFIFERCLEDGMTLYDSSEEV